MASPPSSSRGRGRALRAAVGGRRRAAARVPSGPRADAVVAKVAERTALVGGHTVVALAGATGSGKSSLFNALVGAAVATVGVRRPDDLDAPPPRSGATRPAGDLLDWLGVGARATTSTPVTEADGGGQPGGASTGWSCSTCPTSTRASIEHRTEAERVLELVDLFVWVTDPQKYADARLHDDYVAALATHEAVTMVVLNQADRLDGRRGRAVPGRPRAPLAERDGVPRATVLATSARTGEGIDELRHAAGERRGRTERCPHPAGRRRPRGGGTPALRASPTASRGSSESADGELVDALARAAGVPTVVAAVERDYRLEACGPHRLAVHALGAARSVPTRSSACASTRATSRAAADARCHGRRRAQCPRTLVAAAARTRRTRCGRPRHPSRGRPRGRGASRAAGPTLSTRPPRRHGPELADALDQAVVATPLRARDPLWWSVLGYTQTLLALASVAGLLWLVVLGVIGWLQLPEIETPRLGPLPYPFLLLAGGLLLGLLLAVVARACARVGGRRRAALINRRLRDSVTRVARGADRRARARGAAAARCHAREPRPGPRLAWRLRLTSAPERPSRPEPRSP